MISSQAHGCHAVYAEYGARKGGGLFSGVKREVTSVNAAMTVYSQAEWEKLTALAA